MKRSNCAFVPHTTFIMPGTKMPNATLNYVLNLNSKASLNTTHTSCPKPWYQNASHSCCIRAVSHLSISGVRHDGCNVGSEASVFRFQRLAAWNLKRLASRCLEIVNCRCQILLGLGWCWGIGLPDVKQMDTKSKEQHDSLLLWV